MATFPLRENQGGGIAAVRGGPRVGARLEKDERMKNLTGGLCAVLATSMLSLGCGGPIPDEDISQSREAINVSTWAGLVAMGTTGSYVLTANINAAGKTWTPKTFSGTFNGGNFTISNLTINNGSFFSGLTNATVKNVKFTNLTLTGGSWAPLGGLAGNATNTTIENCAVEANINVNAIYVGGILGGMTGGSIYRSYAKGSITGVISYAGGFVGTAYEGNTKATITDSYAQVTVNPDTSSGNTVIAGGLVGWAEAPDIHDVYAVGNVTGRGGVGGMVGYMHCTPDETYFLLYKTIYRGDVVDKDWSASGGWAGPLGQWSDCTARFVQNFYDRTLDSSTNYVNHSAIERYTTTELRSPTTVTGGVYCNDGAIPGHCGDNTWYTPPWTAGTNAQHHALQNMPGPNAQPR